MFGYQGNTRNSSVTICQSFGSPYLCDTYAEDPILDLEMMKSNECRKPFVNWVAGEFVHAESDFFLIIRLLKPSSIGVSVE